MASPQSPSATGTGKKEKKEESILDKLGTIARKKKVKEGRTCWILNSFIFARRLLGHVWQRLLILSLPSSKSLTAAPSYPPQTVMKCRLQPLKIHSYVFTFTESHSEILFNHISENSGICTYLRVVRIQSSTFFLSHLLQIRQDALR